MKQLMTQKIYILFQEQILIKLVHITMLLTFPYSNHNLHNGKNLYYLQFKYYLLS
jgi:hypothetical protein